MVEVRKLPKAAELDPESLHGWLCELTDHLDEERIDTLAAVIEIVRDLDRINPVTTSDWTGEADPLMVGLEILHILAELHLDIDALAAGVIYRPVREQRVELDLVRKLMGDRVADLVDGVLRMAAVSELRTASDAPVLGQATAPNVNIRRMLVAMVDDVRIALIKLAERTVVMRTLKNAPPEQRQRIAQEVFDVYAPLAHRLGIGHIKWELEDLSFRYLRPDAYHRIAKLLDGRRKDRDVFIDRVKRDLERALADAGLTFELSGRAKHIYSIWRKMQRKGIGFSQVYDIRALRILVPSVQDCYHTLGVVHGMWRNIPNEFDDYIANPKENGYRSLHTAVIGPEGKILEVQIRTQAMHEEAELGVCAHWVYKGSDAKTGKPDTYEAKLSWLRQVLEWHESVGDDAGVAEQFSFESAQDRVYVFTPKGDVVSLADGATPLDFAYHVHTEVGHRCRGAKVNGAIVPLTYRLKTGERVQILTGNDSHPRRDWLQSGSGYLRTSRARTSVQQWFKSQTREDNIAAGRNLVERECSRLALTSLDYRAIASQLGHNAVEDMFAAVGAGDLTSSQIMRVAQRLTADKDEQPVTISAPSAGSHADAIRVDGVGNLLTHFAKCCLPVPGDAIEGFITKSRGVTIHRADCPRLLALQETSPERLIAVSWGEADDERYEVQIELDAYDRQGLLADVTSLLAKERVNVTAINTISHRDDHTAKMRIRAEVPSLASLGTTLSKLTRLDNVITANRVLE